MANKVPYLPAPIPKDETERLKSLHNLGLLDTPTEERFDRITKLALSLFNVPISTVTLIDSQREWFKSCQGLSQMEGRRAISFCGHAMVAEDVFVIPDTKKDPRFAKNPMVIGKPFIRFYAGIPLKSADGKKVGVFCVKDLKSRKFNQHKKLLLKTLASLVELELNVHELSKALEARRIAEQRVAELNGILRLLNKTIRHDILNDLTVMKINIELFLNKKYGMEVLKDAELVIERSVKFMRGMRDLEAAVSYGTPLKPYQLKEVIKQVSKNLPAVKFNARVDGSVLADEALVSVVENIARNAQVHGETNEIDVATTKERNFIHMSLADLGKGIPDNIKNRLFIEGFKYGTTGNSGLGLYIARKTVERYGGQISVTDNQPKGTKFIITLPKFKG